MADVLDPDTPLARVPNGWVMQRITGGLYVQYDGGGQCAYSMGHSVADVVAREEEKARRLEAEDRV